ncbi:MAG: branched-chain amino acid ABC transporter substrate-binding protein [Anaerolineaceae bacterium]|nr:branched-chain amino acid ABC transporter substrate-binding protein [Anaerolineaceae bacterium]
MQRIHLLFIFVLIATLSATPVFSQDDASVVVIAPGEPILIGVYAEYGTEDRRLHGIDVLRGIRLALDDWPAATVDSSAFPFALDVQTALCTAEDGAAVAEYFTSETQAVGVIGPTCSSACLAAAPIYDAAGFSTVSPGGCTAHVLVTSGFTSFNHTSPTNIHQARIGAAYIFDTLGLRRIATIRDNSPYAIGLERAVTATFIDLGGEVVATGEITVGEEDYAPLLAALAESEPQLIYFAGFPDQAVLLLQQRAAAGLADIPFFGGNAWLDNTVIERAGDAAEGAYVTADLTVLGSEESRSRRQEITTLYEATFGEPPVSHHYDKAYDALIMFLQAIEAVGALDGAGNLVLNRADIAAFLRSFGPYEGISGRIECDGSGECASAPVGIWQVQGGAFTLIEQIDTVTDE